MDSTSRSILSRYGFAVWVTIVAILLRHALGPAIGPAPSLLLAVPAVLLAALYGGMGPGLFSCAVSLAGAALDVGLDSAALRSPDIITRFAAFAVSSAMISAVCERLRWAQTRSQVHARAHSETREDLLSSQRELQATQRRLEGILASVSDAYYTLDRQWRFTHLNPHTERHLGVARGELLGQVVWDALPQARGSEFERRFRLAMETSTPQHIEGISLISHRWLEVHVYPFDGGLSVFFRDITERKEMEQAMREREAEFRAIFELAAAGKVQTDACSGRITRVNRRFCELMGCAESELLGRPLFDLTHPDDRPLDLELITPVFRGEREGWETEKRFVRKDGTVAWVHVNGRLLRDSDGRPRRTIATVIDVTERKRYERVLREREDQLRLITNALPALISYVDADCRYQLTNQACERWFQRSAAELKGCPVREVLGEAPWRIAEPYLRRALAGERVSYEQELPHANAGSRWVHVDYTPDRDESGMVRGVVVLLLDITDAKRTERALREATAVAERANRAKDQFLAVLSHELRTPLTPVLTAAQMLESEAGPAMAPEERRELATMIRRNVELEARLIDDLLDLTRVSRGKLLLTLEAVDVHGKVREVARACSTDAEARHLRFRLDLRAERHHVRGDQARFQQVLSNLLRNAIKFSHPGGQITVVTRNDAPDALTLEVIDQGVGIDADLLPRLFNAFEQGGRDMTRQFGGLGLGLAICKALVVAQGGRISAHSEGRERGATLRLTMPLAQVVTPAQQPGGACGSQASAPREHRILLVEDHEDTSRLMARLLRDSGYAVKTAATVADALRTADSERFDVVVSDLGLPDGTGHDLMQQLLARYSLRGVAISGYGMEEDVRRARQSGFVEHLTKPVNASQFLDTLDRVLSECRTVADPVPAPVDR